MSNYPTLMQSEEAMAPWNAKPEAEVNILVSLTISKPVTVLMPVGEDYTEQELLDAAKEQMQIEPEIKSHWDIDDFAVVEE